MRAELTRVEADVDGARWRAAAGRGGPIPLGPLEVDLTVTGDGDIAWAVANRGDRPVRIRSVAAVLALSGHRHGAVPLRMFRNGYQSWSPSGVATFGVDADPSTVAGFEFLQAVHHADQRTVTAPDELRSEWVTLLAAGDGPPLLAGFDGGASHDGTLRLRHADDGDGVELWAEAFLGDAELAAGASRRLHTVVLAGGPAAGATPAELLDRWATRAGRAGGARVDAPYQLGWCSWYHYFHGVTEDAVRRNLTLADGWPFDVFQLDDGFQAAIGDWLVPNGDFPTGLPGVAGAVRSAGLRAGVWLAPFLAAPDSQVATAHPDWLARTVDGAHPLRAWWNPQWGGGGDGFHYALDTTRPEVLAHLQALAAALVDMGFSYLKLDFTFAPAVDGRWHDPTRTPAERVRAGYAAIRRGAGDDAFLLGCGVPLANVVGLVDGCRIGPDVAPCWALDPADEIVAGYLGIQPATRHAWLDTAARSFMHRRLWLNDPDCLMLRTADTALSPEAARTWARAVGVSGGMALVSDDLAVLDGAARALLDEAVALGRASDDAARAGRPVVAPDLLDAAHPRVLVGGGHRLHVDAATGASTLLPAT
ncbi:MAG TPA: glycoside hydrolase family 36 protein [Acidimicrobiales bacterium]